MAHKKVGKKRGAKHSRKPPLHVVSDFGSSGPKSTLKRFGKAKGVKSKGNFGAK